MVATEKQIIEEMQKMEKEGEYPTNAELSRRLKINHATMWGIISVLVTQGKISKTKVGRVSILKITKELQL